VTARGAAPGDAATVARIYNEGIEDGDATFETAPRAPADVEGWLTDRRLFVVVVEDGGEVVAWARASAYRPGRRAYDGVAEFSVYVARSHRGRGAGRAAMEALIADCESRGFHKLLSRVFPENEGSRALCRSLGFRDVGLYKRHGRLRGEWRDNVIVEKLLGRAAGP
jgi:phosphinothricin acetyltransferase